METNSPVVNIEIKPGGPILIKSTVTIKHVDGAEEIKTGVTALCRCGASANKPFCDGAHKKIDFKD
jgi:CDGSH-type Zn-finger protein